MGLNHMDRRKELKEMYKNTKPSMGVFMIKHLSSNRCYIESAKDLIGIINSSKFKLGSGLHFNKELQKLWTKDGESNFIVEILENLPYEEAEAKVDYTEELNILKLIWVDRLKNEGMELI